MDIMVYVKPFNAALQHWYENKMLKIKEWLNQIKSLCLYPGQFLCLYKMLFSTLSSSESTPQHTCTLLQRHSKQQPAGPKNKKAFSQLFQPVWVQ